MNNLCHKFSEFWIISIPWKAGVTVRHLRLVLSLIVASYPERGGEGGRNTFIHFILRKPWFTPGLLLASSNHSLCECACTGFYIEQLIHALGCIFELWCMWEVLRVWMKHLQQFLNYSRCSWEQLLTRFLVAFETFQVYHNLMMHS